MHQPWINKSKLAIPAAPPAVLGRSPIPGAPPPVVILAAGPGYGKSVCLRGLATAEAPQGAITLWYGLDPLDADPATFFHYLVAAVQRHIPAFGTEVLALLAGDRQDPRLLWQRWFQDLDAFNLPAVRLVLDDAHHLFEPPAAIFAALAGQFERLPPGLQVLVAARRRPPLALSRLKARGVVAMIDEDVLRFGPAEVDAYLAAQAGEAGVPEAWRRGAEGLDGWPLGLALLTAAPAGRAVACGADELTAYVAEELYQVQPPARRRFMLGAALLEELTPEACREVLGCPDAREVLEELEAERSLLRLGQAGYRFPTYLRDFLVAEAARSLEPAAVAAWHHRASAYYEGRGELERALPHRLAGGDWTRAVAACEACFPAMRFEGRHAQIARWLAAFPPVVREAEPALVLWSGHTAAHAGRPTEAATAYDQAQALYEARGDAPGIFKLLVRRLTLAARGRDLVRFGRLSMQAQGLVSQGRVDDVADFHLARAMAADHRGDVALVRECNEAVLGLPLGDGVEVAASVVIARINLFTAAFQHGKFDAAAGHVAQAIAIAEDRRLYAYHRLAVLLEAHLRLTVGDPDGAGARLRGTPADAAALLDPHMAAVAHVVEGAHHAARGALKEAEEAFRRALATFEAGGYVEARKLPLEQLAWLAILRRQYPKALELAAAEAVGARTPHDHALDLVRARALDLEGRGDEALEILGVLVPELAAADSTFALARSHLFAAAARQRRGEAAAARDLLARATGLIEAYGYGFLRGQDRLLWEELAPVAAAAGHPTRSPAADEGTTGDPGATPPTLAPAAAAVPAAASPSAPTASPSASPPASPPGMLTLRCLGTFDVRRDDVPLDQWPRRKAKLVLAALALRPLGLRTTELAELVGNGDAESGHAILRVNLPILRRTLEPGLARGEESAYVKSEDGRYVLAWDRVAAFDLTAFEQALAAAEADRRAGREAEAAEACEQALTLYRGDLFDDAYLADYFELERTRAMRQAVEAALFLAAFRGGAGDLLGAEAVLRRAATFAPCEEAVYVALMRHFRDAERPDRARQAYWDCRKALKHHMSVEPSAEFEAAASTLAPVTRAGGA